MIQQDKPNVESDLDTQILSNFIYELNISQRHLSTYPPGHPMIAGATEKVLALLDQLLDQLLKQLSSSDAELRLHAVQLAELSKDPAIIRRLIDLLNNGETDRGEPAAKKSDN